MQKEIAIERLREIVDAWGASPSRWPEAERGPAEALLARSVDARRLVDEAARLDALLDAAPVEAPSGALIARLMAARPRPVAGAPSVARAPRGRWRGLIDAVWPYGSAAIPAGTLAASIMLGVMVGSTADLSPLTETETTVAETTADDQLIALAMADLEWPEEWMQ
jgi:hypothetical protein